MEVRSDVEYKAPGVFRGLGSARLASDHFVRSVSCLIYGVVNRTDFHQVRNGGVGAGSCSSVHESEVEQCGVHCFTICLPYLRFSNRFGLSGKGLSMEGKKFGP